MTTVHTVTIEGYYNRALHRGRVGKVWSIISGRSRQLNDLYQIDSTQINNISSKSGIKTVRVDEIHGSEGRARDFDRDFNPRQVHTRERWQSVARLLLDGGNLPTIDLVQVRDQYFVLDGHHRLSVARAFGQLDIEAKVTVWQVEGVLPWEQPERQEYPIRRMAATTKSIIVQTLRTIKSAWNPAPKAVCSPEQFGCTG
jgi:hypothetical protein